MTSLISFRESSRSCKYLLGGGTSSILLLSPRGRFMSELLWSRSDIPPSLPSVLLIFLIFSSLMNLLWACMGWEEGCYSPSSPSLFYLHSWVRSGFCTGLVVVGEIIRSSGWLLLNLIVSVLITANYGDFLFKSTPSFLWSSLSSFYHSKPVLSDGIDELRHFLHFPLN